MKCILIMKDHLLFKKQQKQDKKKKKKNSNKNEIDRIDFKSHLRSIVTF